MSSPPIFWHRSTSEPCNAFVLLEKKLVSFPSSHKFYPKIFIPLMKVKEFKSVDEDEIFVLLGLKERDVEGEFLWLGAVEEDVFSQLIAMKDSNSNFS